MKRYFMSLPCEFVRSITTSEGFRSPFSFFSVGVTNLRIIYRIERNNEDVLVSTRIKGEFDEILRRRLLSYIVLFSWDLHTVKKKKAMKASCVRSCVACKGVIRPRHELWMERFRGNSQNVPGQKILHTAHGNRDERMKILCISDGDRSLQ